MVKHKFKIGDIVHLKSDALNKMTVDDVIGDTYKCIWFDVTIELQVYDFREEVLELSNSPMIHTYPASEGRSD